MSEAQTMAEALTEMAGAVIDEPLDAVQVFYPGGRWNTGPTGLRRLGRLITGRGRLDDKLPTQSVLIVTDVRVIVYTCGTSTGRFALHELVGAWPRPQVSAKKENVDLSTSGTGGSARPHHKNFLRLTLQTPDGRLVADLPARERATTKVSKALRAA